MYIGLLQIEVLLQAQSLKEKRFVVKGFKDRIRSKFNIAVAETDFNEKWQRSQLSMVVVGNEKKYLEKKLRQVLQHAIDNPLWAVNRHFIDFY